MGFPMAGHLTGREYKVTVYNRSKAKAIRWKNKYQGEIATTLTDAITDADFILSCVGNDNDVRGIYDIILQHAKPGAILVDHTTTSAQLARELAKLARNKEMEFIDAPLSGGQIGAEQGALTIMAGGDQTSFDKAKPVFDCYAKSATLIGDSGFGQTCKMVNQICVAGVLQGLSEGLNLAKASGLDASTLVNVLRHGAASSWQMINRTESMMNNQFDFGFAIDWMRKDLSICFDEAEKLDIELPLSKLIDQHYAELQLKGYGRLDTSALIKQFE